MKRSLAAIAMLMVFLTASATELEVSNVPGDKAVQAFSTNGQDIGRADWEERMLFAVGYGQPPVGTSAAQARLRAKRAALDNAMASMRLIHHQVHQGRDTVIRHLETVTVTATDEGGVQVTVRMPMASALP